MPLETVGDLGEASQNIQISDNNGQSDTVVDNAQVNSGEQATEGANQIVNINSENIDIL